jgi:hypothetical protein
LLPARAIKPQEEGAGMSSTLPGGLFPTAARLRTSRDYSALLVCAAPDPTGEIADRTREDVGLVERPEPNRINVINAEKGTEIEIVAYTDSNFALGPGTLMPRAASNLQHEYERLLRKPVQVTTLEPTPNSAAMRWTATWIDGNFAQDDRALSLEEFILEPAPDGIVEITVSQAGERRGEVTGLALETLTVQLAPACQP